MTRLLLPLALAARSRSDQRAPDGSTSDAAEPINVSAVAARVAEPGTTSSPTSGKAIPAAFRGRWAFVPNDCDASRGDNKGLMTVAADVIRFYGSRARPRSASARRTALSIDLDFSGEGQRWREITRSTLTGDVLRREASQPPLNLTYERCPA